MPPTLYFSSPYRSFAYRGSFQPSPGPTSKKRKRDDTGESADGFNVKSQGTTTFATARSSSVPVDIGLDSGTEHQNRSVDHYSDNDTPINFPHSPLEQDLDTTKPFSRSDIAEELGKLKPPLHYVPTHAHSNFAPHQSSLKQRHQAMLITIVHKSLLEGDYMRAGRAWGMMLRTESHGSSLDPRSGGFWGIGAEILLQQEARTMANQSRNRMEEPISREYSNASGSAEITDRADWITYCSRRGFENVKSYYERLILQYPFQKWSPETISSLHFYPAMFGLWIHSVQSHYKETLAKIEQGDYETDVDESDSQISDFEEISRRRESARQTALREAQSIVDHLEELLLSFPFSDDHALWHLRGMMGLWAGDLCAQHPTIPLELADTTRSEDSSLSDVLELPDLATGHSDAESLGAKAEHIKKSNKAFERAETLRIKGRSRSLHLPFSGVRSF